MKQDCSIGSETDLSIRKQELGFSLIEIVVAMVIFTIVTGAIWGLLQISTYDRNRASRKSDVMKNARATIHLIGRDALNAGLGYHQSGGVMSDNSVNQIVGLSLDPDTERDSLTSIMVGNNLLVNSLHEDPSIRTDIITFAYRDFSFNDGKAVKINPPVAGASASTARITSKSGPIYKNSDPIPANLLPIDSANRFNMFIIEGDSSQVAVMATQIINSTTIDFATGDPLGINQSMTGSGTARSMLKPCAVGETVGCTTYTNATLKKFSFVSYRVMPDGTLMRMTYGNNSGGSSTEQIQQQPLAYNIKNFQITYVLRDGSVTDNPAAGPDGILGNTDDTPGNVNLIAQITVTVDVQATEADEQTKQFSVTRLTSTFGVRNLQYDAG